VSVSDHSGADDKSDIAVRHRRGQENRRRNVVRDSDESNGDLPARQPTERCSECTDKPQDSLVAKRSRQYMCHEWTHD